MLRPSYLPRALLVAALTTACAGGEIDPRDEPDARVTSDVRDVAVQQDRVPGIDVIDVAPSGDVVTPPPPPPPGDGGMPCSGNRDGVIERGEMAFLVGASVIYVVNRDGTPVEPVDTVGMTTATGRVWNYVAPIGADQRLLDELIAPRGRWWSSRYPDASFAAVIDRTTNLLGVYRVSDAALELLATVSTEENRTDLRMTPPVAVLRFPLRVGSTWEQTVTGTGFVNFTALTNTTRYVNRIDADGEVWTPAGRFRALRMRTDLDQSIPLTLIRRTRKTFTFVSECWGVVARISSADNETTEEFRRATEYRRLGL